jgi:hypothetical protein
LRLLRGYDILGIEKAYGGGASVVSSDLANVAASICPGVQCANLGSFKKDCSCLCAGAWTGATCTTCGLTCGANGRLDAGTCSCKCNDGYHGTSCEFFVVGAVQDAKSVIVKYSLDPTTWKGSLNVKWFKDDKYGAWWNPSGVALPTNVNAASGTLSIPPGLFDFNYDVFYLGIEVRPRDASCRTPLTSTRSSEPLRAEHARSLGVLVGVARKERIWR